MRFVLEGFIKALKPKIQKLDITNDIQNHQTELDSAVLPRIKEFNAAFGKYKFKSPVLVKIEKLYQQRNSTSDSLFTGIEKQLTVLSKNFTVLAKVADKVFPTTVYKDALSIPQALLLQYITSSAFVVRYSSNLLTLALIEEAGASGQGSGISMVKGEVARIDARAQAFVNSLHSVSEKGATLEKRISAVPDVFATEESLAAAAGDATTDPFGLNLFDSKFNPFYFIGMISAERQAAEYLDAKEDFEVQESLLLNLKLAQARKNDPKLEQKIKHQVERVQKIRRSLDEMEKKYGLAG